MELIEGIKGRRSVRKFTDEKISHDTIEKIVDAARFAPTWKNSQTPGYVVVEDRNVMIDIAEKATFSFSHNKDIIKGAAALVVLTSINKKSGYEKDGSFTTSKGNEWQMFDAGLAAEAFTLAAYNYGVGTVILGIFDDAKVGEIIGLDDTKTVSALIPIGIPEAQPNPPKRNDVSEYLSFI